MKNQYIGDCLKGGGLGLFVHLRGGACQERGGGVFEGGVDTSMTTMPCIYPGIFTLSRMKSILYILWTFIC